jgi:anthranilate synthase component 2
VIVLVDSYDSFTFNLVHSLARAGARTVVVQNDQVSVGELLRARPDGVVLSPGPGRPEDAGILIELCRRLPAEVPLLGVCLGHQALVLACGGELELDPAPVHGRASLVHHAGSGILRGLPDPFPAARYHSIRAARLPSELALTAWTDDGIAMAVEHVELPRFGVQFHPESILTPDGDRIVASFVELASGGARTRARAGAGAFGPTSA